MMAVRGQGVGVTAIASTFRARRTYRKKTQKPSTPVQFRETRNRLATVLVIAVTPAPPYGAQFQISREWRRPKQPHLGTRVDNYRCSLPGLAGFTTYRCEGTARVATNWRRGRDSNPRYVSVYTLSRRAPSTARPPLRDVAVGPSGPAAARARIIPQHPQVTSATGPDITGVHGNAPVVTSHPSEPRVGV